MGPIEETGKVATSTIDALKTSPPLLAMIVLQLCTLAILGYNAHMRNTYETSVNNLFADQLKLVMQTCGPRHTGEAPFPLPLPNQLGG